MINTKKIFFILGFLFIGICMLFADGWCSDHGQYTGDYCPNSHEAPRKNSYTNDDTRASTTTYDIYRIDDGLKLQGKSETIPIGRDNPYYDELRKKQETNNPSEDKKSLNLVIEF